MGITKEGWRKRKANGNGIPWNKGKKGVQVSWNKGKSTKGYPKMGFQKGHKKFTSPEGIKAAADKMRGENHFNWKGGITPLLLKIRNGFKTRQWRNDVFTRDDFTCQDCLARGGKLEAHHIKEFSKIIQENKIITFEEAELCSELWDINNGLTLCVDCHKRTDNYGCKANKKT